MKETFSERLKRLRSEKNLTASEMAKRIDVAQSTYRDWENGKGLKPLPYQKLSQVLAVSVTELVTGEKPSLEAHLKELQELENKITEIRTKLLSVS